MKTWIANFKQYNEWLKNKDFYQTKKGNDCQYKMTGFNFFTGKIIFNCNNFGMFGVVEKDAAFFTDEVAKNVAVKN